MQPSIRTSCICSLVLLAATAGFATETTSPVLEPTSIETLENLARPVLFEDHSSADAQRFVARGAGYIAVFEHSGLTLGLSSVVPPTTIETERKRKMPATANLTYRWLREELVGSNEDAILEASADSGARAHYFTGSDASSWRTDLRMYGELTYRGVYDQIDLRGYDAEGLLERDFIVHPGGEVGSIAMRYPGAESVALSPDGQLLIETPSGVVAQSAPVIFQGTGAERTSIDGRYVLRGEGVVGFEVSPYDTSRDLVIDPMITYATYLGATGSDAANGVAVDGAGNFYVVGATSNPPVNTFPMAMPPGNVNGTIQNNAPGAQDAFVTKYSPSGQIIYSAILGGSNNDGAQAIAVGSDGSAYIGGFTSSNNFPTMKPIQTDQGGTDGFVTVLNPAGLMITFSTYVGGQNYDDVWGLALDGQEDIIITGEVDSPQGTFQPVGPSIDLTFNGGSDAYLAEIRVNDNSQPVPTPFYRFKTYLGSPQNEYGQSVAVGSNGNMYVVGQTNANAKFEGAPNPQVQTTPGGNRDGFLFQVNEGGGGSQYFTFFGGSQNDEAQGVDVTASHEVVFCGYTDSTNFPSSGNAFQTSNAGGRDAWVAKINALGSARIFSTYLGGSMTDQTQLSGNSCQLNEGGDIIITGGTNSANFPTFDAIQAAQGGETDAFVAVISGDGATRRSATFLGGTENDQGFAVAHQGPLSYLVGQTSSTGSATGFPVTPDAAQLNAPATPNGYVAVVMLEDAPDSTSFQGTVSQQGSGTPVPAATVTWGPRSSTSTAADGSYSFTNLPCETNTLTVSKAGFTTFTESYTPTCNAPNTKNVQLTASGPAGVPHPADTNADFAMSGGEASLYGSQFVNSSTPPSAENAARAGFLFRCPTGQYTDNGGTNATRWVCN